MAVRASSNGSGGGCGSGSGGGGRRWRWGGSVAEMRDSGAVPGRVARARYYVIRGPVTSSLTSYCRRRRRRRCWGSSSNRSGSIAAAYRRQPPCSAPTAPSSTWPVLSPPPPPPSSVTAMPPARRRRRIQSTRGVLHVCARAPVPEDSLPDPSSPVLCHSPVPSRRPWGGRSGPTQRSGFRNNSKLNKNNANDNNE